MRSQAYACTNVNIVMGLFFVYISIMVAYTLDTQFIDQLSFM